MRYLMVAMLLSFVFVATASAGDKEVFIQQCGSCHKSGGQAAAVNPGDKAGTVWKKYFKRNRHPEDLSAISSSDMKLIITFLYDHAADSDQPASAVIPQ